MDGSARTLPSNPTVDAPRPPANIAAAAHGSRVNEGAAGTIRAFKLTHSARKLAPAGELRCDSIRSGARSQLEGAFAIATPFLRWAGAKRRQSSALAKLIPEKINTYYEPFLGSGALFFRLEPEQSSLGDRCGPLIDTYGAVISDPLAIYEKFSSWPVSKEHYSVVREMKPKSEIVRAAQFIYLNKTCWNGLYRVNRSGRFNVPYGMPKTSNITSLQTLLECSKALAHASLAEADFQDVVSNASAGDVVFLDPPYASPVRVRSFVGYNATMFSWQDQVRLAKVAESLAERGVKVIVTNGSQNEIRAVYGTSFEISERDRASTIASSGAHRKTVTELWIVSKNE